MKYQFDLAIVSAKRPLALVKLSALLGLVVLIVSGMSCVKEPGIAPLQNNTQAIAEVSQVAPRPTSGPLPGLRFGEQPIAHISVGQSHPAYNSWPATSGWHYGAPLAPTRWGIHSAHIQPEVYLHNIEHGGIGIFYDCPDGCDQTISQLSALVDSYVSSGGKVLLAPHSDTNAVISLTAWTFLEQLDEFDEERIRAFVNAHESSPNSPEPNAR